MSKKKTSQKIIAVALSAAVLCGTSGITVNAEINKAADIPNHSVGVVGSFNGWDSDIQLTDADGDGIYEGVVEIDEVTEDMIIDWYIDSEPTGESYLQFKVRLDNAWSDSWGYYEPLNDRTWNSQSNVPVKEAVVGQPLKFTVYFDIKNPAPAALANPDSYAEPESDDYNYLNVYYKLMDIGYDETVEKEEPSIPEQSEYDETVEKEELSIPEQSENNEEDGIYKSENFRYKLLDDGTVELLDTTGDEPFHGHILEIPETIDGKVVSSVNGALDNSDNRSRYFLPKTLTNLNAERTFFECSNITRGGKCVVYGNPALADLLKGNNLITFITMPDNIVKSGDYTYYENGDGTINIFTYDGDEKDIIVPSEIDGKRVFKIDDCAFFGLQSTETIKIPGSIEYIGKYSFAYLGFPFTVIKKVEMEEGLKDIDLGAFFFSRIEEIIIPKSTSVSAFSFNQTDQTTKIPYKAEVSIYYFLRRHCNYQVLLHSRYDKYPCSS